MANESRLAHLAIISLFAAGIVAVGYTELRKWYKPADAARRGKNREIASELHGIKSSDEARASIRQDRKFWYRADKKSQDPKKAKEQGLAGMLQRMAP